MDIIVLKVNAIYGIGARRQVLDCMVIDNNFVVILICYETDEALVDAIPVAVILSDDT